MTTHLQCVIFNVNRLEVQTMFVKENLNPKNKKVADCVIRAIAKAENKTWLEVFDLLTKIARENYSVLNDKTVYSTYLNKYPKINVKHEVNGKKKRLTVKDVCKLEGTYIVKIANHLTVVIDGKYYDIWDCGNKCAYVIWKVKY